MIFINYPNENEWRIWDQKNMKAINYNHGFCDIDENRLGNTKTIRAANWHSLYQKTHFCPLEVEIYANDVWIAPDGKYYDGVAHDVTAEKILNIIYGVDGEYAGDQLESMGWIRATTTPMWKIRLNELKEKRLTQRQYNALLDWCVFHKIDFPL